MTCFLFVLRLAKDLARTLKEGLERRFFGGEVTKHITTHPSFYTVFENAKKVSFFNIKTKRVPFIFQVDSNICLHLSQPFVYIHGTNVSYLFVYSRMSSQCCQMRLFV